MHYSTMIAMPVGVTLDRFIKRRQSAFPFATGELSQLLRDIALASKIISGEINQAGLSDVTGAFGAKNVQGECQQKLDVIANIRFIRALKNGGEACAIVSEEEDDIIYTGNHNASYVVAIDPLDGSSNIDVNVSIGTIFSIYRRVTPVGTAPALSDFMQGGRSQVAAGYILYGSSTMLVYTTGHGVNGFTYVPLLGEFILSHPDICCPDEGRIYSCNDGNLPTYPNSLRLLLSQYQMQGYMARYIGSLVADLHRNLLKGGVYFIPNPARYPTVNSDSCTSATHWLCWWNKPGGWLRLVLGLCSMCGPNTSISGRRCTSAPGRWCNRQSVNASFSNNKPHYES